MKNKRKALFKALATALVEHGRIRTTIARAESLSSLIENLIAKTARGDLASRRLIGHYLGSEAAKKLLADIAPKYKEKNTGGHTKVLRLGRRMSDGAEMAIIEFIS